MIKEKITVSFAYNPIDNYWWLESDNLSEKYRKNAYHSTFYEKTFFSFKNNHELSLHSKKALPSTYYVDGPNFYSGPNKISMPESFKQRIFSKATELLEERLDICSDRQADTFRALKLKDIINKADFNHGKLVVIKVKNSHSKWYSHNPEYAPSVYLTLVPKTVENEALELQKIRKKHQDDPKFDLKKTSYRTKELRCADHNDDIGHADIAYADYIMKYGIDAENL